MLSTNFNDDFPPLSESDCQQFIADPSSLPPDKILCTKWVVFNLLNGLDTSKASCPDGISSKMLKGTAHSTTSSITILLICPLERGRFPQKWKVFPVVSIPKSTTGTDSATLQTIDQFLSSQ